MTFKDLPYCDRKVSMGNLAETSFTNDYCERMKWKWHRFGLDGEFDDVMQLPIHVRHIPDFIVQLENDTFAMVECKGGSNGKILIKVDAVLQYRNWFNFMQIPIWYYLYDSTSGNGMLVYEKDIDEAYSNAYRDNQLFLLDGHKQCFYFDIKKYLGEIENGTTRN